MTQQSHSVRQLIREAFIRLMERKSYMDITVSDIVREAGVARVSFYRNFNSINDIIDDIADEIADELLHEMIPVLSGRNERKWRTFLFRIFYHFSETTFMLTLSNLQNISLIFARINTKIQMKQELIPSGSLEEKYAPFGKFGLICNILKKWMDDNRQETPEEMVDYIMRFILLF